MAKKNRKITTAGKTAASKSGSAAKRGSQTNPKAGSKGTSPAPAPKRARGSTSQRSQNSKSNNDVNAQSKSAAQQKEDEQKKSVGEILKTTDGFLGNRPKIKKTRRVAVVQQREDDGAVAIVRIFKAKDKRVDDAHAYIQELVLLPDNHPSLTEESIVEAKVILGIKTADGKKKPIYPADLTTTDDKLTDNELKHIQENIRNDTEKHRQTFLNTLKQWFNHFKK